MLLCVSCSIMERLSSGVGVAEGGGMGSKVRGRGSKFGGLAGWVGFGCSVIVSSSVDFSAGRKGWSGLSVVVLTLGVVGTLLGVAFDVLEVVGGGGRESDWVGGEEGGSGVFIGSCGFGSGESLDKFFLLQWAC